MQSRESKLKVGGLTLHVSEWGEPDARPLIALHGIRGYGETFAGLARALQPEYRLIAYDQRGRGESDWDPGRGYYNDRYVADLEAVATALGLERFDLLGHSMGGIAALVYAAANPARVRRLVIEDAGPGAFENSLGATRIRKELAETPERFADWDAASVFMRALRPSVSEAARQQRLANMLKPLPGGGFTWRYDHAGIAATRLNPNPARVVDLMPSVRAIACPTLVLRGGRSDYLQPEMVAAMEGANPRIRSTVVADAGHYLHDDQPAVFEAAVREFLLAP